MKPTKLVAIWLACSGVLVPACFIASLAIATLRLVKQVPVYQSTAQLRYPDPEPSDTFDSFRIVQNTYAATVISPLWLAKARTKLDRPADEIDRALVDVAAKPVEQTSIIALEIQTLDPLLAADFANAWAATIIEFYGTNQAKRPALIRQATPSYTPITPGKLETIRTAAVAGLGIGLLLSTVSACIFNLVAKKEQ